MRLLLVFLLLGGCSGTQVSPGGRDFAAPPPDAGFLFPDEGVPLDLGPQGCDDQRPCAAGRRCHRGLCIPDLGPCALDDDCQNDSYCVCAMGGGDAGACQGGICVPYGLPPRGDHDPECLTPGFSASAFKAPVLKCAWRAQAGDSNVLMTPLVVDLDRDGKPEIVFATHQSPHPIAIRGADCTERWNRPAVRLKPYTQMAAADLDGDKFPELVALGGSGVVVLDHDGNLLASGGPAGGTCSGPAIADVDGQGGPEILVDGSVLRYRKGNPQLELLFTRPATPAQWGNVSLFADFDGDGRPEVATGLQIYDGVTGADQTPATLRNLGTPGAYPAVADFNRDGHPDLVVVQSQTGKQRVAVVDVKNDRLLFGPYAVADGGWGGTPTVGDYDGDGVPDFGLASSRFYYVYALKCAKNPKPADCKGQDPGVLWQRATRDASSGGTGSSTFDFNGDGSPEVIYRDECWLRVMSGPEGKTLFAQTVTSGTCLEYPVVADVDADGHADLVVPSDNLQMNQCNGNPEGQSGQTFGGGPTAGIFVYQDPLNRWMPSRRLWTAHTYHISEIDDDLSVPPQEPPSWLGHNTYRKNVQGKGQKPLPAPDLTAGAPSQIDNGQGDCQKQWILRVNLCNRGTQPAPPGTPGTFYGADPRQGNPPPICTAAGKAPLAPGQCETLACDWKNPPQTPVDLWFRANDDGKSPILANECKAKNGLFLQRQVSCNSIG